MFELADAQERILACLQVLPAEHVSVAAASGRFLASDVAAPIALPAFDNSAMDGYAVRVEDVAAARNDSPVPLRFIGSVPAGASLEGAVAPGTCVRIFTGSPLPRGADAVVMQEDTRASGATVEVLDAVKPWENVRLTGQDIKAGAVAARRGEPLTAPRAGLLAALGVASVSVARQPTIALLGTGNELVEPGTPLQPGQIYESNRTLLAPLIAAAGGVPRVLPLVLDDPQETATALRRAFDECDGVITTGGVSVGEHDYVKAAFESLGGVLDFWKVNIKPGKPFVFGRLGEKFLFGLPGNPVSAFVTFLLLVRPALLRWQGATATGLPAHPAILAEELHNRGDRRHFMRVVVNPAGQVRSAGLQASHALSSLAAANALLEVPPHTSWSAGQPVQVLRWSV